MFADHCQVGASKARSILPRRAFESAEATARMFNSVTYCKGAVMLNEVLAAMGAPRFFAGLSHLVREHAFGTITQAMYVEALAAAAPDVPVAALMQFWLDVTV